MWIIDFLFRRHRAKTVGIGFAIGLPALMLAALFQMSEPISEQDMMKVAAIALHDHYSVNPPYGVWTFDGVRINEDERLVVDVNVSVIPHATFIETRNQRVRYSYLKLACPLADAGVNKWLDDIKVWINLTFHDKTLIEAPCPRDPKAGVYAS
ncbi:MAG: hypothetical protein VW405_12305 [Rhodospirillaceae bacterium]